MVTKLQLLSNLGNHWRMVETISYVAHRGRRFPSSPPVSQVERTQARLMALPAFRPDRGPATA